MNKTIPALPNGTTLDGTEPIETVQGSASVKTTTQAIANLAPAASPSLLVESGTSKKISALSAAGALAGTEPLAIVQGGVNVQTTPQAIADLANTGMTMAQSASTSYTFGLSDNGTYIEFTSGSSVTATIPTNASAAFPIGATILFEQNGTGVVTVVAAVGVTLQSAGALVDTNGQFAAASLVKKDTDRWGLNGNLT